MATAATATPPTPTATGASLLPASILGALVLLAGLAAAGYWIPHALESAMSNSLTAVVFRVALQIAAFAGVIFLVSKFAGESPPKGIRGGIFLVVCTIITVFLVCCAILLNMTEGFRLYVGIGLAVAVVFFGFKFITSNWARGSMIGLEEMGWFHTFSYKKTQGLKMRRYTIVGILIVGFSGIWSLMSHGVLDKSVLSLEIPFMTDPLPVLTDPKTMVPLLMAAAILWLAWRAVNVPVFADFLIATEAEMNKVSWTPRRRLFQDTVVVLITTLLLTAFLLVIDLFWGWLLSLNFVGVLPSKEKLNEMKSKDQPAKQRWEPPPPAMPTGEPTPPTGQPDEQP